MSENKELPEGLVEEVRRAMANGDLGDESVPYYYHEAKAALSVIAPYYEKQIAELKAQIPQWLPISEAPKYGQILLRLKSSMFVFGHKGTWGWILYGDVNETDEAFISHFLPLPKPPAE